MLVWLVAVVALAVALLAWRSALKTSRRLDQLTQMYWALRYQQTAASRGEGEAPAPPAADAAAAPPAAGAKRPADGFISLSSLKQKQDPD